MAIDLTFVREAIDSVLSTYGTTCMYYVQSGTDTNDYGEIREEFDDGVELKCAFSDKPFDIINQEMQLRNSRNNENFVVSTYDAMITLSGEEFETLLPNPEPNMLDQVECYGKRYRIASYQITGAVFGEHTVITLNLKTLVNEV